MLPILVSANPEATASALWVAQCSNPTSSSASVTSYSRGRLWTNPLGKWFPLAERMAKAMEVWPMHVIEEALGDDADGILPQAIRSEELRVRLPRHHIDMLHYRADHQETTVSGVLARELDGIASAHIEEPSGRYRGFADAMAWPGEE
ncbi:MAG TPA: hypothetical protein VN380_06965 [Thermoanaerobaculia bacterium]|jgi:hypothetical protein|nr:hypothetical protein [Thermoanaerobaculia bacterium]